MPERQKIRGHPLKRRSQNSPFRDTNSEESSDDHTILTTESFKTAEKSRKAAKSRRDKEAEEMEKLAALLPFTKGQKDKIDKGATLRLVLNYLRMKKLNKNDANHKSGDDSVALLVPNSSNKPNPKKMHLQEGQLMLHALNGFLIFINKQGIIYFVSPNVEQYTGARQEDMIGRNFFEFIHQDDYKEVVKQFHFQNATATRNYAALNAINPTDLQNMEFLDIDEDDEDDDDIDDPATYNRNRLFYVRMKCHYHRQGTKTRHTGFVLTQVSGRMKLDYKSDGTVKCVGLVAICRSMQSSPIIEINLSGNMFMSRHGMDMRFTFADARVTTLLGYEPDEVIGKTAYQFHNPVDAPKIHSCHSNLIVKGTSVSKYYRFLGKTGSWVWMQTRATIIYNSASKPQYVNCMNYIIGEQEGQRYLLMEQEERGGIKDESQVGGAIDLTAINSPSISSGYSSGDEEHLASPTMGKSHWNSGLPPCSSDNSLADSQYLSPGCNSISGIDDGAFLNDIFDMFPGMTSMSSNDVSMSSNVAAKSVMPDLMQEQSSSFGLVSSASSFTNPVISDFDVEMLDEGQENVSRSVTVTLPAGTSDPNSLLLSALHGIAPVIPAAESMSSATTQSATPSTITSASSWLPQPQAVFSMGMGDLGDLEIPSCNLLGGSQDESMLVSDMDLPPLFPECVSTQESNNMLINDVIMAPLSQSPTITMMGPPKAQMTSLSPSVVKASQNTNGHYSRGGHVGPVKNGIKGSQNHRACMPGDQKSTSNTYVRDEHNYFKDSPRGGRNGNSHVRFAFEEKRRPANNSSILEQFLTTKEPLNPRQTSDHIARRISQLHIADRNRAGLNGIRGLDGSQQHPNLLKKLLTEKEGSGRGVQSRQTRFPPATATISSKGQQQYRVQQLHQQHSSKPKPQQSPTKVQPLQRTPDNQTSLMPPPQQPPSSVMNTDNLFAMDSSLALPDPLGDIDLLSTDIAGTFNPQWGTENFDELFLSDHEIGAILREESRHEEEWLKEFFN